MKKVKNNFDYANKMPDFVRLNLALQILPEQWEQDEKKAQVLISYLGNLLQNNKIFDLMVFYKDSPKLVDFLLKEAVKLQPQNEMENIALAGVKSQLKEYDEALEICDKVKSENRAAYCEACLLKAYIYSELGNWQEAASYLNVGIQQDKQLYEKKENIMRPMRAFDISVIQAKIARHEKNFDLAVSHYLQSILTQNLSGTASPELYVQLLDTAREANNFGSDQELMDYLIQNLSGSFMGFDGATLTKVPWLLTRAEINLALGNKAEAKKEYENILSITSDKRAETRLHELIKEESVSSLISKIGFMAKPELEKNNESQLNEENRAVQEKKI